MRKYNDPLDPKPARTRRSRAPVVFAVGLLLLVAPLAYEGGKLLVSNWMAMAGVYSAPETPVLDAIAGWSRDANVGVQSYYHGAMHSGSWRPTTAVPLAITWAILMGVVFLRRVS